jgi:hypothetical protein
MQYISMDILKEEFSANVVTAVTTYAFGSIHAIPK